MFPPKNFRACSIPLVDWLAEDRVLQMLHFWMVAIVGSLCAKLFRLLHAFIARAFFIAGLVYGGVFFGHLEQFSRAA